MPLTLTQLEAKVAELEQALAQRQAYAKAQVEQAFAPVKALQEQLAAILKTAAREDDVAYQTTVDTITSRIGTAAQQLSQSVGPAPIVPTL